METHRAMGHVNIQQLQNAIKKGCIQGIELHGKPYSCEICSVNKSTNKKPDKESTERRSINLELIHSNIAGPFSTKTATGKVYFLTFIDDKSRMCWTYLLSKLSEDFGKVQKLNNLP